MSAPKLYRILKSHSYLAWPAWLRVLAVLPVLACLWFAVAWATGGVNA